MKMAQFARFANNATNQVLGVTGLQLENLQSMFSYPDAINVTNPKLVSGGVIYIDNGAPLYAKRAKVFIEPFQAGSGDPSPSNVRAISGWNGAKIRVCGNNIFNPNEIPNNARQSCTVNGNKFVLTVLSDGTYKSSTFEIEGMFGGSTLHLSGSVKNSSNNDGRISVRFLHGDTEISANNRLEISAQTGFSIKQAPQGTTKLLIVCYSTFLNSASKGDKATFTDMVLSLNNELYTPFVSHDYSITFPDEAGTVYGGVLDVVNGILTVNRKAINLGERSWTKQSGTISDYFSSSITSLNAKPLSVNGCCSSYNLVPGNLVTRANNSIGINTAGSNVYVRDDRYTDANTFKQAVNNQILIYELNEPIIYNIDPTDILMMNGVNTVFADCGSMELEYYRRESGVNPYV